MVHGAPTGHSTKPQPFRGEDGEELSQRNMLRKREDRALQDERRRLQLRPQAKRMRWHELCDPEKKAIRALLLRLFEGLESLEGSQKRQAVDESAAADEKIGTGFLVFGRRGSGKTTVLLNAARATEEPNQFFYGVEEPDLTSPTDAAGAALHAQCREYRRRLLWLEPLDMELLPEGSNLLTTLLIWVRDALERACDGRETSRPGSGRNRSAWSERDDAASRTGVMPARMLEEGDGLLHAWEALDELIQDATLMWEGVSREGDVRKQIDPNIQSAETFLKFEKRLRNALERATSAIGRRYGARDDSVVLVLPIDNADRNAPNVYNVLRLVRLVYFPKLWFVLTASRQDLDTFLQASFEQKLRSAGKLSQAHEEELVRIARQQAAAMQSSALPLAHQIEVERMSAQEVLMFEGPYVPGTGRKLMELLGDRDCFGLPRFPVGNRTMTLLDLMLLVKPLANGENGSEPDERFLSQNVMKRLLRARARRLSSSQAKETDGAEQFWFSRAGQHALTLPVRAFLDLKQAADRWSVQELTAQRLVGQPLPDDPNQQRKLEDTTERAIELVYEMLQGAIAESNMPDEARRLLTDKTVLYRNDEGLICLDLRTAPLCFLPCHSPRDIIDIDVPEISELPERRAWVAARIVVNDFYGYGVQVRFERKQPPGPEMYELKPPVSGWMMLLYDLLKASPGPRVIYAVPLKKTYHETPRLVQTEHEVLRGSGDLFDLPLPWTMPCFETLFEIDIFTRIYEAMIEAMLPPGKEILRFPSRERLVRLLMAGWFDCVLTAISLDEPRVRRGERNDGTAEGDWRDAFWNLGLNPEGRFLDIDGPEARVLDIDEDKLGRYEGLVYGQLHEVYERLRGGHGDEAGDDVSQRSFDVRAWIEEAGCLLRGPEYLGTAAKRPGNADSETLLAQYWQRKARYLGLKRRVRVRDEARQHERDNARAGQPTISDEATEEVCKVCFEAVKAICERWVGRGSPTATER